MKYVNGGKVKVQQLNTQKTTTKKRKYLKVLDIRNEECAH